MNKNDITRRNAQKILKWCIDTYGKSKYNSNRTIRIRFNSKMPRGYYGEYDAFENVIDINPNIHKTFLDFVNTLLHEYVHFTQNIKHKYHKYKRNYDSHPYEISAENKANRDSWKCKRELFNKKK